MAKGIKIAAEAPAAPLWSTETSTVPVDQGQPSTEGGTGGLPQAVTATGIKTIDVQYATVDGVLVDHGYIIAQKGARKFLVADSSAPGTNTAVVFLVNKAAGDLAANEASISCINTAGDAFYANRISTKHVYDFVGNKYIYKVNVNATTTTADVAGY